MSEQIEPNEIVDNTDPIKSYNKLENEIINIANKTIPLKQHFSGKTHSWWNDECSNAIKQRNKARNKFAHNKTTENYIAYKKAQAVVKRTIKQSKKTHWIDFCDSFNTPNSKTLWKVTKAMLNQNKPYNHPIQNGNTFTHNDQEKSNIFGNHFSNVSSNKHHTETFLEHKTIFEDEHCFFHDNDNESPLNSPITFPELHIALKNKKDTSPGKDKIQYSFIKKLAPKALFMLLQIFNLIFNTGQIPPQWKHSVVIPIIKPNKSPYDPFSYRPISLTSCICKLFETIMNNRLKWFLEYHDLLHVKQSGFRNHHSTIDHLLNLSDNIRKTIARRKMLTAIFLDITKAYDLVWPKGVLFKMNKMGIKGKILKFCENFILNRKLQVRIGNSLYFY